MSGGVCAHVCVRACASAHGGETNTDALYEKSCGVLKSVQGGLMVVGGVRVCVWEGCLLKVHLNSLPLFTA